jgi:glycerol-3-phosphate dehydrogenase
VSAVAVVGAGIFGCAAAVELARAGHRVDLYERHGGILYGATRAQQGRLHSGYHYPRSPQTIAACRDSAPRFAARWPAAIRAGNEHHYAVSWGSRVSLDDYLATLDAAGLPWKCVAHPLVRKDTVAACLRVPEALVDITALQALIAAELVGAGVAVRLSAEVDPADLAGRYDWVVSAAYGRHTTRMLRYEIVETALVRLGPAWAGQSVVVVDGPFTSVDPHSDRLHMLYDVHLSVHGHTIGRKPEMAEMAPVYGRLLDRGPFLCELSRFPQMLDAARMHLTGLDDAEYRGSMWTVRAVLPDVHATDARPTLVERDGNVITVLGGKMCTALTAAVQVLEAVSACEPVSSPS